METLPCLRHPQPWHSPGGAWRPASEVHDLFHPPRAVCSAYSLSSLSLALPMPRWCSMKLTVVNVQVFCDLTCGCCCLSVRHWVSTCLCEVAMSSRCRQREREREREIYTNVSLPPCPTGFRVPSAKTLLEQLLEVGFRVALVRSRHVR